MSNKVVISKSVSLKKQGYASFKAKKFVTALSCYTSALQLEDGRRKAVLYKNRAAVYMKVGEYEKAARDCSASLDIVANDPLALYRRCVAYKRLGKPEEAYADGKRCLSSDPGNRKIRAVLARLRPVVRQKLRDSAKLHNKIDSLYRYAFASEESAVKRVTAFQNLLVVAKEKSNRGRAALLSTGVVGRVKSLLEVERHLTVRVNALQVLGLLCDGDESRTKHVLAELGVPWFVDALNTDEQCEVSGVMCVVQLALNSLMGMRNSLGIWPNAYKYARNAKDIDAVLACLVRSVDRHPINKYARDSIIEMLTRSVHYNPGNWTERLVDMRGLQRLLEVAAELLETTTGYEPKMAITEYTHANVSVCLSKVYDNMTCDKSRQKYVDAVNEFLERLLLDREIVSKVRVVSTITVLLMGPVDVGNSIVSRDCFIEMILAMATADDKVQQKVACECIIAATSKMSNITPIVKHGAQILKTLYESSDDDDIRIRALAGLCKLDSSGRTNALVRPFSEDSTLELAKACCRFLVHSNTKPDTKRWAVECLSYLTLDVRVKEKLIEDQAALVAVMGLAESEKTPAIYALVSIFVNLCNAYEKQEVVSEMIKCHVPEDHELDDVDFVNKRIAFLCQYGVITVLVQLSKTESLTIKELISRLFNAFCVLRDIRGEVAKQGGIKALLELAHFGTAEGKRQAAQALARIGMSIDPDMLFKEQHCLESIQPVIELIHPNRTALENFESIIAQCNKVSANDWVQYRMFNPARLGLFRIYLAEKKQMIRRGCVQYLTNLMMPSDVIDIIEGGNDKLKKLFLLCEEEDENTALAATEAIEIAVTSSIECCKKLLTFNNWEQSLKVLLVSSNSFMQHRALVIVYCLLDTYKKFSKRIFDSNIMEVLMVLSDDEKMTEVRKLALCCLEIIRIREIKKLGG